MGSPGSWSLHVEQLCVVIVITVYCKNKSHWWGLGDALINGYKDKDLGDSLIIYSLSRIIVLGSLLGPMTWSVLGLVIEWWYQARVLSCGAGFKSNQKVVGCSHIMPLFHYFITWKWTSTVLPLLFGGGGGLKFSCKSCFGPGHPLLPTLSIISMIWACLARPVITEACKGHSVSYMRPFQERKKQGMEGRLEERKERRGKWKKQK